MYSSQRPREIFISRGLRDFVTSDFLPRIGILFFLASVNYTYYTYYTLTIINKIIYSKNKGRMLKNENL
jgi:hypothetical protein